MTSEIPHGNRKSGIWRGSTNARETGRNRAQNRLLQGTMRE